MRLTEDILINEILARLPVKSLTRFKCVSKEWRLIIENPEFVATHFRFSKNNSRLVTLFNGIDEMKCDIPVSLLSLNVDQQPTVVASVSGLISNIVASIKGDKYVELLRFSVNVVGSCNGLFCLSIKRELVPFAFALWNPAIKELREVKVVDDGLLCYESVSGFGYDGQVDDYKVVMLKYHIGYNSIKISRWLGLVDPGHDSTFNCSRAKAGRYKIRVMVFSRRSGSFRVLDDEAVPRALYSEDIAPSVDGELYWIGTIMESSLVRQFILVFNMSKQVFRKMETPNYDHQNYGGRPCKIETRNGDSLGLFVYPISNVACEDPFALWVMNKYRGGECWNKLYAFRTIPKYAKPMLTWRGHIVSESWEFMDHRDPRFSLYDPIKHEIEYFPLPHNGFWNSILDYKESFVSVYDRVSTEKNHHSNIVKAFDVMGRLIFW